MASDTDTIHTNSNRGNGIVPFVPWDQFMQQWNWKQGQHVALIGPTGRGKTTLITHILSRRNYVVFFGTKRRDDTQDALIRQGYRVTSDASMIHPDIGSHWMLRPPFPKGASPADIRNIHRGVYASAIMHIFRQGGWTVVADEIRYLTDTLRLADGMELLWLQGRSLGITVVGGTQRPRHVPLEAYSQSYHLFFWQTPDKQDVARVAELTSIGREKIAEIVPNLTGHTVLYVNTVSGDMLTTKSPGPS